MTNKILVIYHGNCADGFTSAWIARKVYGDAADYFPGTYGDSPPDVSQYTGVFMLDFSYKRPVLVDLATKNPEVRFIIFDHHKTAQEDLIDLPSNVNTVFNMEESGASLTWDYFFPNLPRPDIVELVKDRDLWHFKDERTRPFAAGLFARTYEFANWDFAAENIGHIYDDGKAIERKHFKDIEELMPKTRTIIELLDGDNSFMLHAYNLPYTLSSDVGNIAAKRDDHPFGCCYWIDGDSVVFSLRSIDTKADVSKIAKFYEGGGHRNAAGFKVTLSEFVQEILPEDVLG